LILAAAAQFDGKNASIGLMGKRRLIVTALNY
jgi:hypothetical protein